MIRAVGSRRLETAKSFADAYKVPIAHGTYEALLGESDIDAVYLSLPNSMHHEWTLKALEAGKHVLCEKPIACSSLEAEAMYAAAKQHGRVLVEAFMYRSHPQTKAVLEEIRNGVIGRVKLIRTSFCYRTRKVDGNIRFSRELAGGALMDIGCYCVDLARLITKHDPVDIQCTAKLHETGVDEYACGTLRYADDVLVTFCCGMSVQTDNAALICGDEGYIRVPVPWKPPVDGAGYIVESMTPPKQDGGTTKQSGPREVHVPFTGTLYGMEADDFAACVLDGIEPAISAEDSLSNMRVLDSLRGQIESCG